MFDFWMCAYFVLDQVCLKILQHFVSSDRVLESCDLLLGRIYKADFGYEDLLFIWKASFHSFNYLAMCVGDTAEAHFLAWQWLSKGIHLPSSSCCSLTWGWCRIFSCLSPSLSNFRLNMNHPEYSLFNSPPSNTQACTHVHTHTIVCSYFRLQFGSWLLPSHFFLFVILSFIDQNSHLLRSCSYFTVQLLFISHGYL